MVEKVRSLGLKEAYAIGLGTMIAAGIFSLSGTAVAEIGSTAVLSFVIAAVIAGVTAAAYSEFSSIYSESGGGYLFTSRTFKNDYLVFTEGLMLFFGYTATTAFYLATAGEWIHRFIIPFLPPWLGGVIIATALGILNARGTEESGTFQVVVSAAKVVVLLIFIAGVFVYKPPGEAVSTFITNIYVPNASVGLGEWVADVAEIASLAFITFFGFSAIAASAGEIKNPKRTVPLSIAASIVTVTILYAMVIFAMVNSPVSAEVIAEEGETAMGRVASAYLGDIGLWLIVAGAIFSMASASNASILAASRIGFLMGKEGRAFRRLQNISIKYDTPIWSIILSTGLINLMIILFMGVFHGENALFSLDLGLETLTGFATTNLLIPLTVVNIALIFSRRKFKEMDRPFRLPLVPLTPIVGIIANLYLVWTLPRLGVVTGVLGVLLFVVLYFVWGGQRGMSDIIKKVEEEEEDMEETGESIDWTDDDNYNILIPVRGSRDAVEKIKLAEKVGGASNKDDYRILVLHDELLPEQVPTDQASNEESVEMVEKIESMIDEEEELEDEKIRVTAHITRNIGLDIVQTAREIKSDLIMMGYPVINNRIASSVQARSPCDIAFARDFSAEDLDRITLGAGAGPHHQKLLPFVRNLGIQGSETFVVSINPREGGSEEDVDKTVSELAGYEDIEFEVQNQESDTVAEGLVQKAKSNNSCIMMGQTRDSILRQRLFGSTPDKTAELAYEENIPIIIYGGKDDMRTKLESSWIVLRNFFTRYF